MILSDLISHSALEYIPITLLSREMTCTFAYHRSEWLAHLWEGLMAGSICSAWGINSNDDLVSARPGEGPSVLMHSGLQVKHPFAKIHWSFLYKTKITKYQYNPIYTSYMSPIYMISHTNHALIDCKWFVTPTFNLNRRTSTLVSLGGLLVQIKTLNPNMLTARTQKQIPKAFPRYAVCLEGCSRWP